MNWLDRLARRTARHGATAPAPTQRDANRAVAPNPDKTRRDFLKKAGIVGGLAWTAPVLQSVIVPAAAASGEVPLGGPCGPHDVCAAGAVCYNGQCGAQGAQCLTNGNCFDASCSPHGVCGGLGAKCFYDNDCYHLVPGTCHKKVCGGPGAPCSVNGNADCQYGNCHKDVCGSKGAHCTQNDECKGSLICNSGVCGN